MPFHSPSALVNSRHLEEKEWIRNLGIRKRDNMSLVGEETQNLDFQCDSKQPSESTMSKITALHRGNGHLTETLSRTSSFHVKLCPTDPNALHSDTLTRCSPRSEELPNHQILISRCWRGWSRAPLGGDGPGVMRISPRG